ncbi:unnamed protein product [Phaeothamnion confervicola]
MSLLESIQTKFIGVGLKYLGSETERRLGTFLFDENVEWASSKDLHGMAALTFNEQECKVVMALISEAMEPADYTWKTLWKAVRLLHHFVVFGAERCVDHAWSMQRQVDELVPYNSAQHSKTGQILGAGVDHGEPVRREAAALKVLLGNTDRIRRERTAARDPTSLLPAGRADDFVAPDPDAGKIIVSRSEDFGVVQTGALGAKFTLEQVPGMYDGRPERYFDRRNDPRRSGSVDDAQWTRQALAPNLLELDLPPAPESAATNVETQDLVALARQRQLEEQLRAQQTQLEQLKAMMGGGVIGGGMSGVGNMSGVGGGTGFGGMNGGSMSGGGMSSSTSSGGVAGIAMSSGGGGGGSAAPGIGHANILAMYGQQPQHGSGLMGGGLMGGGHRSGSVSYGGGAISGGMMNGASFSGGIINGGGHRNSLGSDNGLNNLGGLGTVVTMGGGSGMGAANGMGSLGGGFGMGGLGGLGGLGGIPPGGMPPVPSQQQTQQQLLQQQQQQLQMLQLQLQQQQRLQQQQQIMMQQSGGGNQQADQPSNLLGWP